MINQCSSGVLDVILKVCISRGLVSPEHMQQLFPHIDVKALITSNTQQTTSTVQSSPPSSFSPASTLPVSPLPLVSSSEPITIDALTKGNRVLSSLQV